MKRILENAVHIFVNTYDCTFYIVNNIHVLSSIMRMRNALVFKINLSVNTFPHRDTGTHDAVQLCTFSLIF